MDPHRPAPKGSAPSHWGANTSGLCPAAALAEVGVGSSASVRRRRVPRTQWPLLSQCVLQPSSHRLKRILSTEISSFIFPISKATRACTKQVPKRLQQEVTAMPSSCPGHSPGEQLGCRQDVSCEQVSGRFCKVRRDTRLPPRPHRVPLWLGRRFHSVETGRWDTSPPPGAARRLCPLVSSNDGHARSWGSGDRTRCHAEEMPAGLGSPVQPLR